MQRHQPTLSLPPLPMRALDVQHTVVRILTRIEQGGAFEDRLLAEEERRGWEGPELALLRQLVKGTLQWRGALDADLERVLDRSLEAITAPIRNTLRLGAYQVRFMDGIPKEAAVHQAVEIAKKVGHKGTAGLVNAVLRKIERRDIAETAAPSDTPAHIAATFGQPEWLVERWCTRWGNEATVRLCAYFNTPQPLTARVTCSRTTPEAVAERLRAEGVEVSPAKFDRACLRLELSGARLTDLAAFREGDFQVQDESAVLVGRLVRPDPEHTVLDVCAAPGGKTTHIADQMGGRGLVIAMDSNRSRLKLVRENADRLGLRNIELTVGSGLRAPFSTRFDRILLDAPCSGTGALGRKADLRWKKNPAQLGTLTELQGQLLDAAAKLLKPGGTLVYSTCSLEEEENQGAIRAFLDRVPDFRMEPASEILPPALVDREGYYISLPHEHGMAGAFGAVLRRA